MIPRFIVKLANKIWVSSCKKDYKLFMENTGRVEEIQKNLLMSIIKNNKQTEFGIEHNFEKMSGIQDFHNLVPLSTYGDYSGYIKRILDGEANILTSEKVLMFELSSGSTAASKFIPYTGSLKKEFQNGINPWVYNMYTSFKGLCDGRAYWSISPLNNDKFKDVGKVKVGFEEDAEYFGTFEKHLLDILFAVPKEVKYIEDTDAFRYITLLFLIKERNLSFISIWNPTFMTLILKQLQNWSRLMVYDLKNGEINPSFKIRDDVRKILIKKLGNNIKRAKELEIIFDSKESENIFEKIWPNLRLISSWADASSAAYIHQLKEYFPNADIQPKGLLATEGFISFPIHNEVGAALSINSHFFEFVENDLELDFNSIKLAHQLEKDKIYSVVITTGGGFYRYRLQDLIKVVGFFNQCPLIKFVGKEEKISDHFGEKLNEYHVSEVITKLLENYEFNPGFYMLAAEDGENPCYTLFIEESSHNLNDETYLSIAKGLDEALRENFHYDYCRKLGQLSEVRIFMINKGKGLDKYFETCQRLGQKQGNIKPVVLHSMIGWSKYFEGRFV